MSRCGIRIKATHTFATGIAKEFEREIKQSFAGGGATLDHGYVTGIKYGCDQIAKKGAGCWCTLRRFENHAVSRSNSTDKGTQ